MKNIIAIIVIVSIITFVGCSQQPQFTPAEIGAKPTKKETDHELTARLVKLQEWMERQHKIDDRLSEVVDLTKEGTIILSNPEEIKTIPGLFLWKYFELEGRASNCLMNTSEFIKTKQVSKTDFNFALIAELDELESKLKEFEVNVGLFLNFLCQDRVNSYADEIREEIKQLK